MHDEGRSTETIDWRRLLDGPLPNLVRQGRVDEARRELDAFLADPSATDIADAPRDRSPGRRHALIGNTLPVGPTETAAAARPRKRTAPGRRFPMRRRRRSPTTKR